MANQLFAKKSLKVLLEEMAGEHRLKRVLGPVALTSLGVGAIIGTGIFVLTGVAARNHAGPGLILSFVFAGLACTLAALCYAEFAAMAPVAGSAYTYAYTTLGELMAWIIGWDLVLEYAMGSSTVAAGWSHYFVKFLGLFKGPGGQALLTIPLWLTTDPFTAAHQHRDFTTSGMLVIESAHEVLEPAKGPTPAKLGRTLPLDPAGEEFKVKQVAIAFTEASTAEVLKKYPADGKDSIERVRASLENSLLFDAKVPPIEKLAGVQAGNKGGYDAYENTPLVIGGYHLTFNAVAIGIVAVMTVILVIGIRESAGFNAAMVLVKLGAVLFVIFAGIGYVNTANWTPFLPFGLGGALDAAGVIFFAYIGFDSISTHSEEAKNPQRDVPIGILSSLVICTILYIIVAAVITGMVPYPQIHIDAPISRAFEDKGLGVAAAIITVGALTGMTSVLLVMLLSQPRVLLAMARDGLLPNSFFGAVHPKFQTPHKSTILTGVLSGVTAACFPLEALGHMVSIGTLFAFVVVCIAVWMMRFTHPNQERPFRTPGLHFVAPAGIVLCLAMMVSLPAITWLRLLGWLGLGMIIYFLYGMKHSTLGKELRMEIATHGASPAGSPK